MLMGPSYAQEITSTDDKGGLIGRLFEVVKEEGNQQQEVTSYENIINCANST